MKIINLFEYSELSYDSVNTLLENSSVSITEFIQRIKLLNTRYLNQNNESSGIFTLYRDYIKANNYVGFALFDKFQIQILPKISQRESDWSDSILLLLKMIDVVYDLNLNQEDFSNLLVLGRNDGLHELFIRLFSNLLIKESKNGLYREYINITSEEPFLKGKLLLSKQIKKLPCERSKFSVEYDIFSENNELNQLFRRAILTGLNFTKVRENRKLLNELNFMFSEVDPMNSNNLNTISKKQLNRLKKRFEPAFYLANLLLSGFGKRYSKNKIFSFFLDMNMLFQHYVYKLIKKEFYEFFVKEEEHIGPLLKGNVFQMRPDIIIKKEKPKVIVEVKYKELSNESMKENRDVYQVYGYSKKSKCDVILIYPKLKEFNFSLEKTEYEFFDQNRLIILPFDLLDIIKKRGNSLPLDVKNTLDTMLKDKTISYNI